MASDHTYSDAVLAEAKSLIEGLGLAFRGTAYDTAVIDQATVVIEGDVAQVKVRSDAPALDMPLSVLIPVDEDAGDFAAEEAARRAEAEETLFSAADALQAHPKSTGGQVWLNLHRGNISLGTARPDLRTLCAQAKAPLRFIVRHIRPART